MQLVLRPEAYDVIVTQNLNGDYISDLAAALVGGPGYVPSGNIGDGYALFESTHGTAWDMWKEASERIYSAVKRALEDRIGTPDIAAGFRKQGIEAKQMSTDEFAEEIIKRI